MELLTFFTHTTQAGFAKVAANTILNSTSFGRKRTVARLWSTANIVNEKN